MNKVNTELYDMTNRINDNVYKINIFNLLYRLKNYK